MINVFQECRTLFMKQSMKEFVKNASSESELQEMLQAVISDIFCEQTGMDYEEFRYYQWRDKLFEDEVVVRK